MDVSLIIGIITALSGAALSWYVEHSKRKADMEENKKLSAEVEALRVETKIKVRDAERQYMHDLMDDMAIRHAEIVEKLDARIDELEEQLSERTKRYEDEIGELKSKYTEQISKLTLRVETLEREGREKDELIEQLRRAKNGL